MTRRILIAHFAGLVLALPFVGGCSTTTTDAFTLDFPITAQAVALDITNFRGNIDVRVDPDLDTFKVESDTTVRHEFDKSDLARKERAVEVRANVEMQHGHAVLRVRSLTTRPGKADQKVNIYVRMPRCDGLRIENGYGNIELVDVRGAMEITNRQGHVEMRTSHPITEPIAITTVNGNIYYQVPPGSTGVFDLKSLDGEVRYVDRVGASGQMHETQRNQFIGRLEDGENPVVCRTNKGRVLVWVIEDPVALTRALHGKVPTLSELFFLKGSRRHTRNLPDDHPEVQAGIHSDRPE